MEQPQHESAYGAISIGETGDVRGLVQEEPKSSRRSNLVTAAVGLAAVLGVTGVLVALASGAATPAATPAVDLSSPQGQGLSPVDKSSSTDAHWQYESPDAWDSYGPPGSEATADGTASDSAHENADDMSMPTEADGSYSGTYVFKKTFMSVDPSKDVGFMSDAYGFMIDINQTVYCSPDTPGFTQEQSPCSVRGGLISALIPEVHFYQSFVTPEGEITVSEWVDMWSDLNSDFDSSFEWHEFMHMATTFYTPDLSPFLKLWEEKQYSRLHRSYVSNLDNKTMYSVRMAVPNTGTVIEVIADHVDAKWVSTFEPYKTTECGPANHLPYTQRQLKGTWKLEGGADVNSSTILGGLPLLLMVQISHPADKDNLDDLKTYLEEHTDYSSNYKQHYDYTQECAWSDLTMAQLIATEDGTSDDKAIKLNLRLTANLQAKQGSMNSTFYSQYVTTTVQEHAGNNQGYSRYLDNHIGIDIANLMTLDWNARSLQSGKFAFHSGGGVETGVDGDTTHNSSNTDDDLYDDADSSAMITGMEVGDSYAGSNWARGKSGVNFEFRGSYDNSFFNVSDIVQLDYCSPDGFSKMSVNDVTYCPKISAKPSAKA